jgi:hypothetical protein
VSLYAAGLGYRGGLSVPESKLADGVVFDPAVKGTITVQPVDRSGKLVRGLRLKVLDEPAAWLDEPARMLSSEWGILNMWGVGSDKAASTQRELADGTIELTGLAPGTYVIEPADGAFAAPVKAQVQAGKNTPVQMTVDTDEAVEATSTTQPTTQPAALPAPNGAGTQPVASAADRQLEPLWDAMKDANAATALEAVKTLESKGSQAVAFLRKKLSPISELNAAGVRRLIDQLDATEYAVRQRATDELSLHGICIADPLVNAQGAPKSLESRVRLDALVKDAYRPVPTTPAASRWLRAVRVLERIGTPAARDLLGELAKGAAGARGTQQAQEAINRLGGGAKIASLAWWLARAEEEVETVDTGFQGHYFGQISAVLADAGLIDAAAAMERRSGADLEARYHLAAAYARAGQRKEAQEVAYMVHNPDGVVETRCRIGIALASAGRVEPVVPPQSSADWMAATVAHAFSAEEAGTWKVRKSLALSAEARIHAAIAVAHAAAGRKELYRKHIDLAQGLTDKIDVDINASWAASLSSDSKAGEAPGVDIFSAINKTSAIEAVALARARVGDYDGARAAVNRMRAGRSRDSRMRILAEDLSDRGVLKEALATAEGIEEKTHRDLALLSVVGGFLRAGDRAGAQAAADKLRTEPYQTAARLALRDEPEDQQDYQAVARHDVTVCRLARIQAQTPGRNPVAILRWIQTLPRSDQRYYALLGVAEGILAAQGPVPPAPSASSRPAVRDASPPATQPAPNGASTEPATQSAGEARTELAARWRWLIKRLGSEKYAERDSAQRNS